MIVAHHSKVLILRAQAFAGVHPIPLFFRYLGGGLGNARSNGPGRHRRVVPTRPAPMIKPLKYGMPQLTNLSEHPSLGTLVQ